MRVVDVVGGTGAGKSAIGNAVANHLPPPAGNGFKEGQTAESETTEVATLTTQVTLAQPLPSGISGYTLSWSDTQGVSDTNGRTVDFLDHIVEHMRANPPNGIVLMYNAEQKDTASVRLGHKAMKLCFNESLPDGRTILVMNKMKSLRAGQVPWSRCFRRVQQDLHREPCEHLQCTGSRQEFEQRHPC